MIPGNLRPEQGEIYWADLDPVQGNETAKTRPVVVINAVHPRLDVRLIAPLLKAKPYHAKEPATFPIIHPTRANGIDAPRVPDVYQMRSISMLRFGDKIGKITKQEMAAVCKALSIVAGYNEK